MKSIMHISRANRSWYCLFRLIPVLFALMTTNTYAVDLLAPFRGLFGDDDNVVVWKGQGQYIKIVEQDWDKDHKRAPRNDHPAKISAPHMAVVLASLQAWRPEDAPESDRSVPLFTNEEISQFAPILVEALAKAGPKQDVVFAFAGVHDDFAGERNRTSAGRMFMLEGRLHIIFGDILRHTEGDADDISHFSEPHRAGRRLESNGRDIVVNSGLGLSYYTPIERPRLDWIMIDVPALVAAYRGPALVAPPMPAVSNTIPVGDPLSYENRKLREELARLRKENAGSTVPAPAAPPLSGTSQSATYNTGISAKPDLSPSVVTPAPNTAETVQSRLQLLKDLHDKGLITDQEYDAKRAAIVDEI